MSKDRLFLVYSILLGVTFILSSFSKMVPIAAFEFQLVRDGITSWTLAPYLARALVFTEFLVGVHLILFKRGRILYLGTALLLLILFSLYLAFVLVQQGNQANCGCFGQLLPMSTTAALIKNIVLLIPGLYFIFPSMLPTITNFRIELFSAIIIFGALVILFPVKSIQQPAAQSAAIVPVPTDSTAAKAGNIKSKDTVVTEMAAKSFLNQLPQVHSNFAQFSNFSQGRTNLDKNVQLLALFSLDCEHCLALATKIGTLQKKHQLPILNALLFGESDQIASFQSQANVQINYMLIPPETFFPLLKKSPPRLILLAKGNTMYDAEGDEINLDSLKQKLHLLK